MGISLAQVGDTTFTGYTSGSGTAQVRDPRTSPRWHSLSAVPGFPGTAVRISMVENGDYLLIGVLSSGGTVTETTCQVAVTPGTGVIPAWPGNCSAFVNQTPPN